MTESRRQKIETMLEDDPKDVFLRYSLGMELSKEGELDAALAIFQDLSNEETPHVPSFFRSAQLHADEGNYSQARERLRSGIDVARLQGDMHAAAEMSEMLSDLGSEGE